MQEFIARREWRHASRGDTATIVANTLILPDGVRLAERDELPGKEPERAQAWSRIQQASIGSGFVARASNDERFGCYAEANVDANRLWTVFRDLCRALLPSRGRLVFADIDDTPEVIFTAEISAILSVLQEHSYQLSHDGYLHFGIVSAEGGRLNEVFVAPTKHLQIWLNDESALRGIMEAHGVPEVDHLEFLDEYPRTTSPLTADAISDRFELQEALVSKFSAGRTG